jgi:hypothetical protein
MNDMTISAEALSQPPLDSADLIARIEAEHAAVGQALGSALAHALACGELLIEAKRQVKHGEWRPWIEANCMVPARTARHYMALARRKKRLTDENGNVLPLSVHAALRTMKELQGEPHAWPYDPEEMTEFPSYSPPEVQSALTEAEIEARIEAKRREWRVWAWGTFGHLLQSAITLGQLSNPPATRHVTKAVREGKTPGLTAAALRDAIAPPDPIRRGARPDRGQAVSQDGAERMQQFRAKPRPGNPRADRLGGRKKQAIGARKQTSRRRHPHV